MKYVTYIYQTQLVSLFKGKKAYNLGSTSKKKRKKLAFLAGRSAKALTLPIVKGIFASFFYT